MAWNRKASPEDMDRARDEAAEALARMPQDAVRLVANWWNHWYMKVGHRRLGRLLLTKKSAFRSPQKQHVGNGHVAGGSSSDLRARITDLGAHIVLVEAQLDSSAFFVVDEIAAEIRIILNTNHPAYKTIASALRSSLEQKGDKVDRPTQESEILLKLLIGWAEVERHQPPGSRRIHTQMAREDWGRAVRDLFVKTNGSEQCRQ